MMPPRTLALSRALAAIAPAILISGCGASNPDGGGPGLPLCSVPPGDGGSGVHRIQTSGGRGGSAGGAGGSGGALMITKRGGLAPVEVLKGGSVDASFTPLTTASLGPRPLRVTSSMTIQTPGVEPAAGTLYLHDGRFYVSDGDGLFTVDPNAPFTGLFVAAGVTLTLVPDISQVTIELDNDLENHGTIVVDNNQLAPFAKGALQMFVANYQGDGAIVTTASPGQTTAGFVEIEATDSITHRGAINASGSASSTGKGARADHVSLVAHHGRVENTGTINADGGDSTADAGGDAGSVYLQGATGVYDSGSISARGGNGITAGGSGRSVSLVTQAGDIVVSGSFTTRGGDTRDGTAGAAGGVGMNATAGAIRYRGSIAAIGGNATGAQGNGGRGGGAGFETAGDESANAAGGDLLLSGDIDCSGGSAAAGGSGSGGAGGDIQIASARNYPVNTQKLALYDYGAITTDGGDGNLPGHGGDVALLSATEFDFSRKLTSEAASITNEAAISARGGRVVAGATTVPAYAGAGGKVSLRIDASTNHNPSGERVINRGAIDTSAGTSLQDRGGDANGDGQLDAANGGQPGDILLDGNDAVANSGALTSNGASDGSATGWGSGGFNLISLNAINGPATNVGPIAANGGDGAAHAGGGGHVSFGGRQACNTGDITARGGNANPSVPSSVGGSGGHVWGPPHADNTQTGTISVGGGTGATPGLAGSALYW